ncbi:RNA polymerase sigma factor [Flavilitoribacter nigricans]|uniref:Sigma-70 family RNA polymerase sigma factor n=1 Tax=Flavilitoribacter nigricans (strain ATCC 23147 / DSM 23189 / NBRC 102662 / NCIMB 1420 / SS-2) TaxID=1122177 RepID=A0A2D0N4H9_FLAN2|nr:RNA polymerase sigma factor [Flavilitoribacter nigricans]PHN03347.1 hypothetical protein CRP01_27060 [Flavilitoribacter nigricans DSM 23189 = NBRC 102662]
METVAQNTLQDLPDSTLVYQYQLTLNEIYFSTLYKRYYEKMNRYCLKALGNPTDAADMVQDVFLKAFEKLPTLNNPELWVAWLFRIARNKIINLHKRQALRPTDSLEDKTPDIPATNEIKEKLELEKKLLAIPRLLGKMPSQQARILRLKYIEHRTIENLCDELQLKESAVKMRLLRARTNIVKMYEDQSRVSA